MAALLNIDPEAARDLEDNFSHVLSRALGDSGQVREIARQLVERLDLCGYKIGCEELHRDEDWAIEFAEDDDFSSGPAFGYGDEVAPTLFLAAPTANDA